MKKVLVALLILVTLLPTTVFADNIEISYVFTEELPHGGTSGQSVCTDEFISSSGDEIIYYCPETLPGMYQESSLELMSADLTLADELMECWDNLGDEVVISHHNIPREAIEKVVKNIVFSNPIYYYVLSGFRYKVSSKTGCVISILPKYLHTDKELIDKNISEIKKATDEILFYIDPAMSDLEKIMTVHDYMVFHYDYDTESTEPNRNLLIMTEKKGVCMAYTLAFTHVMNQLGIETRYISSDPMDHAWNLVRVKRDWYHIDLTWDDPVNAPHYWTSHKYALLSDSKIQSLDTPHYGYDLGDLTASSVIYDDVVWHDGISAVVTVDDVSYWIDGNNIVCENGDIIYENLDGGDSKWSIGGGYAMRNGIYAGLASYNSKLYFNTDKAVYSYNPLNKELKLVSDIVGICGMYIDRNTIYYDMYNLQTEMFEDAGSIHLEDVSYSHPYIENDKLVVKVYKDTDEAMRVFSVGADSCNVATIETNGLTSLEFDADSEANLYFWNENLKPLRDKLKIVK